MPTNNPEYQRKYKQKHYAENKQKYLEQSAARKRIFREEIDVIKAQPCQDCEVEYPAWVMDFDHRPGEEKLGHVAEMVADNRRTAALAEIAKCDLVCANCHRQRTHDRHAGIVLAV